ncbi:succinate dehydrogenase assembly factor 4, mitochondrial [Diachasmimorpha longicaudata]|uniref:succinate dehydrogenase assembly factor 4, mitochondrial n=1 Tax=Diachasmimorpha longicaudata TaxID=58733 RepID=UPI0030B887F2
MLRITGKRLNPATIKQWTHAGEIRCFASTDDGGVKESERLKEFRKKLRQKTPIGKLEELEEGKHPYQEKEPLEAHPNNTNPQTGEVGGPRGPEPTRYGDWERKGRVSDF